MSWALQRIESFTIPWRSSASLGSAWRWQKARLGFSATMVRDGEGAMPQYNFLCRTCKKEFSKVLTLSEHEKGGIVCPACKSKDVEQRWAAFFAVTSKKT